MTFARFADRAPLAALVVWLAAACDDPYPWEAPGSGQAAPAPAPTPRVVDSASGSPSAGPPPAGEPQGAPFVRCAEGFTAGTDPVIDTTKLALSCGPSTGMARVGDGPHEGAVAEGAAEVRLPMSLRAGTCYRFFAVADAGVTDLGVEVRSSRGTLIASDHRADRVAIVQPDRALCAPADDDVVVTISAVAGRGAFALEIWSVPRAPGLSSGAGH